MWVSNWGGSGPRRDVFFFLPPCLSLDEEAEELAPRALEKVTEIDDRGNARTPAETIGIAVKVPLPDI